MNNPSIMYPFYNIDDFHPLVARPLAAVSLEDGEGKGAPQCKRYVTLVIIDRTDGPATILQDQTAKRLILRRTEEVSEALRDAVSLQVTKVLVVCAPERGECPTHDRLPLEP